MKSDMSTCFAENIEKAVLMCSFCIIRLTFISGMVGYSIPNCSLIKLLIFEFSVFLQAYTVKHITSCSLTGHRSFRDTDHIYVPGGIWQYTCFALGYKLMENQHLANYFMCFWL